MAEARPFLFLPALSALKLVITRGVAHGVLFLSVLDGAAVRVDADCYRTGIATS